MGARIAQLEGGIGAGALGLGGVAPTATTPASVSSRFEVLENSINARLRDVIACIDSKAYQVGGRWFCTLQDCMEFSRVHVLEGHIKCFLEIVGYLQFVTAQIVDQEDSEHKDIHQARVRQTPEQTLIIGAFRTEVPPVFGGPKSGWDTADPLSALRTPELWDAQDGINGLFPRVSTSLETQKKKLLADIR